MSHRRRALALGLCLGVACPVHAPAIVGVGAHPSESARPSELLARLPQLSPLDQLDLIKTQAALDPAARAAAAALTNPAVLETRRADVAALVGAANVPALGQVVAGLQLAARADAQVMAAVDGLHELDLSRWYDNGGAAPSARPAKLEPALSWALSEEPEPELRVRALTYESGRFMINGKPAPEFRPKKEGEGFVVESLVHPNDPGRLVKIYRSPGSLAGFERKSDKLAGLKPLADAGAAPPLLEHGEAPVAGFGRVHFYVQKLVRGPTLAELPPAQRPMAEVGRLLDRMADAGMALSVPGADAAWVLARIAIDDAHAYVLSGAVERRSPQAARAHAEMLRALLTPLGAAPDVWTAAAPPLVLPPSARPSDRVAPLAAAEPGRMVVVQTDGRESERRLADDAAVAEALPGLLFDPHVAQVRVTAAVKAHAERRGAKPLLASLGLMKESAERDALIGRLGPETLALSERADLVALLSLLSESADVAKLPDAFWRLLDRRDLERVAKRALAAKRPAQASALLEAWLAQNSGAAATEPAALELLTELLPRLGAGAYARLPPEVWRRLSLEQAKALVKSRADARDYDAAAAAQRLWLAARDGEVGAGLAAQGLYELLDAAPASPARDKLLKSLSPSAWQKLGNYHGAYALSLASPEGEKTPGAVYEALPDQAFSIISDENIAWLMKRLKEAKLEGSAAAALRRWVQARAPGAVKPERLLELFKVPEQGLELDRALRALTPAQLNAIDGRNMAEMLWLMSSMGEKTTGAGYGGLDDAAWRRLTAAQVKWLAERWLGHDNGAFKETAVFAARRWLAARENELGAGVPASELYELLKALPEGSSRDALISSLPGAVFARLGSHTLVSSLRLLSLDKDSLRSRVEKLPPEIWSVLSRENVEWLVKQWVEKDFKKTAGTAARLWLKAHESELGTKVGAEQLHELLSALPESAERDKALQALPPAVFARVEPRQAAELARLIWLEKKGTRAKIRALPNELWARLGLDDARWLVQELVGKEFKGSAGVAMLRWLEVHGAQLGSEALTPGAARALLELLPEGIDRDDALRALPGAFFEKLDSPTAAAVLKLASWAGEKTAGSVYDKIAPEAFARLSRESVEHVARYWVETENKNYKGTARRAVSGWLAAHAGGIGSTVSGASLVALIKVVPESISRDTLLKGLPAAAYAKLSPQETLDLLLLASADAEAKSPGAVYEALPVEAWRRLDRAGYQRLTDHWQGKASATASVVKRLWRAAHPEDPEPEVERPAPKPGPTTLEEWGG